MSKPIVICSIAPYQKHWERSYGHYRIPPGSIENPSSIVVSDAKDKYTTDFEEGHHIFVDVLAKNIAADLIGKQENNQGFFIIRGSEPTKKEMEKAAGIQRNFYIRLVREGDTAWARYGKHEHISDAHRRAAHALAEIRPWNTIAKANIECPSCGEVIPAHVAMCKHCSAVINEDAFKKQKFAGPSQAAAPDTYRDLSAKEAVAPEGKEA